MESQVRSMITVGTTHPKHRGHLRIPKYCDQRGPQINSGFEVSTGENQNAVGGLGCPAKIHIMILNVN